MLDETHTAIDTAATPARRTTATVVTFGCRLNAQESALIEALVAGAPNRADLVVVNTCAVTAEAVRQARQTVRRLRKERPAAHIAITGCAAQVDPVSFAAMPEVDQVIGNQEKLKAETWTEVDTKPRVQVADIMARVSAAPDHVAVPLPEHVGRTRAWVAVQNGCDHRCTFCIIPFGRGPSRSAPAGAVVAEVRALALAGVPEVVLTGVDLTSWGGDLPGTPTLGNLVRRILRLVPELPSLRLSSIDGAELDDALIAAFAEEPRLAPYAHLSLQHGADLILKRMKRRHDRRGALQAISRLRAARPDIAIGCDLIAGFPTETDDHFNDTLSLIEQGGIAFVHAFPFSPRDGTPASRMPPLDRRIVKERAAKLRAAGADALSRHLSGWVGRGAIALAERGGKGRLPDFTEVHFTGAPPEPGRFLPVRIIANDAGALLAARRA
jgi:threonylcarbamoyladenosine tRNA methylthiotransferase MtaB